MAKQDRFAIDKAREINGQPPLTDVEFEALENGTPLPEPEKIDPVTLQKIEPEIKPEPEVKMREMSDDEMLEAVAKKTGRSFTSWDELKPSEKEIEKKQNEEEREADKLSWALKTKKFNNKQYEAFISDSKNPKDLVLAQYIAEALAEDSSLKEDDIEAEFEEKFGLDQEKSSRAYKQGQKQIAILSERILRANYAPILNLENDYISFEKQQQNEQGRIAKIKSGIPAYNKTVDDAVAKLRKIKTQFNPEEEYEVEALEESLTEISAMLRSEDFVASKIINGYTSEEIAQIAHSAYLTQNFSTITKKIVDQALLKKAKGVRGIVPVGNLKGEQEYNLTPEQEILVGLHKEAAEKQTQPVSN